MTETCGDISKKIFAYWNEKNLEGLLSLFNEDYFDHTAPAGMPQGLDNVKMQYDVFVGAFPDLHFELEDLVDMGNKATTRVTITGTHQGELMGIPATGKKIEVEAIGTHTSKDGKCHELWFFMDQMKMMQQLGVIPTPGE